MATMLEDWPRRRLAESAGWDPATRALEAEVLDELERFDEDGWAWEAYEEAVRTTPKGTLTLPGSWSGWQPHAGVTWNQLRAPDARKDIQTNAFFTRGKFLYRVWIDADQVRISCPSTFSLPWRKNKLLYIGITGLEGPRSVHERLLEHFTSTGLRQRQRFEVAGSMKFNNFLKWVLQTVCRSNEKRMGGVLKIQYATISPDTNRLLNAYESTLVYLERPAFQA